MFAGYLNESIDIGRNRCLNSPNEKQIRDGFMATIRNTSEGVPVNIFVEVYSFEFPPLEEEFCLIFHTHGQRRA
ncbi:MAG: hypothetical protein ACLPXB_10090 [Thiobacillaceae bacterium]